MKVEKLERYGAALEMPIEAVKHQSEKAKNGKHQKSIPLYQNNIIIHGKLFHLLNM